jgi:hypothetical protein
MKDIPPPIAGYPKLACHMGIYPELAIFGRFGNLNVQNLLYLQAELVLLRRSSGASRSSIARLSKATVQIMLGTGIGLANSAFEENNDQILVIHEIRTKLKEYSRFLQRSGSSCA